jgi:hypothetical protein
MAKLLCVVSMQPESPISADYADLHAATRHETGVWLWLKLGIDASPGFG